MLPLSWDCSSTSEIKLHKVFLPLSNAYWIYSGSLPQSTSIDELLSEKNDTFKEGYVLRGCPSNLADYLRIKNAYCIHSGLEAVLDLSNGHVEKDSIKKQVKANHKLGHTIEIVLNNENILKLELLKKQARHGSKPQLEYVFRHVSDHAGRCFVFVDKTNMWQAAISLLKRNQNSYCVEVILKHEQANFGVMETLIHDVFYALKKEGAKALSLNEVPFIHLEKKPQREFNETERLMHMVARVMKPAYNYEGLYYFKNKFNPKWQNVYLCASKPIDAVLLTEMAIKMGFANLAIHEAIQFFTNPSKWFNQ